jgi:hypothetical protein
MALIPNVDYPTLIVIGPLSITDGQFSPAVLFSLPISSSPNIIVEYSILRGTITEVGEIQVSANSSVISISQSDTGTNLSGVTLNAVISGSNLQVQYTSTSTGQSAQFWYSIRNITN